MTPPSKLTFRGLPGFCLLAGLLVTVLATLDAYRTHKLDAQERLQAAAIRHWEALELLIEKHEMALASLSDVVATIPPEDDEAMVRAWTAKARRMVLPLNFPGWVAVGIAKSSAGPIPSRTASGLFEGTNKSHLNFRVLGHLRTVPMPSLVGTNIARNQRFGAVMSAVVDDRARITRPGWIRVDPAETSDWAMLNGGRAPATPPVPPEKLTNPVISIRMFFSPHRGNYVEAAGTNQPIVVVFGALVVDHLDALLSEHLADGIQLSIHDQVPLSYIQPQDLARAVPTRQPRFGAKSDRIDFAVMGENNWLPKGPARMSAPTGEPGRVIRFSRRQYLRDWLIEARPTAAFPEGEAWMRLLATSGLGTLLSFAVAITLAIEGRRRRQAEHLLLQLTRADADLRRSSTERQRIVRDLHDQSAQTLTGLSMLLKRTAHDLDNPSAVPTGTSPAPATREFLNDAIEGLNEVSTELRQHMLLLEVFPRESGEWWKSVRRWLERFQRATDCRIELELDEALLPQLQDEDRHLVEAVIRELTSNSIRHGKASRVRFHVGQSEGAWQLVCEDDGVGFDPTMARTGHGLIDLEDRMRNAGGTIQVQSEPGQGTRTSLRWPVTPSAEVQEDSR